MELTQKELVLDYLKNYGAISQLKALSEFSCYRLAAVIKRLRNDGHEIESVPQTSYGGRRYVEYRLAANA